MISRTDHRDGTVEWTYDPRVTQDRRTTKEERRSRRVALRAQGPQRQLPTPRK
ncbi:MAG: hypothetical protein KTR31_04685 [Myxococcales bacterium]|nr:hypothetical protein [Myxococcales bacterium]